MKIFSTIVLCCFLAGQCVVAQTIYVGKLELNKKDKLFNLCSKNDTIKVSLDNNISEFSSSTDFQLIKIKASNYALVCNADTVVINKSKKKIDFSSGVSFYFTKKNAHQIILNDKDGKMVLDAKYSMKGNLADFTISIFDNAFEKELLSYSTFYLYAQSIAEANYVPVYMSFIY